MITRLYRDGLSRPWRESSDAERCLDALRREYDMHQSQYQRNQGRLEAYLSRHWPEATYLLELDSVTLEGLLVEYGSPGRIAADAEAAAKKIKTWGKSHLKADNIQQVIDSARRSLGQPCLEEERRYLQALAEEMRQCRQQTKHALEAIVKAGDGLAELA